MHTVALNHRIKVVGRKTIQKCQSCYKLIPSFVLDVGLYHNAITRNTFACTRNDITFVGFLQIKIASVGTETLLACRLSIRSFLAKLIKSMKNRLTLTL